MVGITLSSHRVAQACGVLLKTDRTDNGNATSDGLFVCQPTYFDHRFGYGEGNVPVIPNRYRLIGALECGWNRRERIAIRLLGLDKVIAVENLEPGDAYGWALTPDGLGSKFGYTRLSEFYRAGDPGYTGKATSPAVVDELTGKVVSNNYHTLPLDFETVWKPYWKEDAPDLYPEPLRADIDLLNQQIYDDINNGTYKVIFDDSLDAARRAYKVFDARLDDYDYRLKTRRYLFGPNLTDSDIRLFQTLSAYESVYRPGIARRLGDDALHVWDYPNLWAYSRDLFQTPGFIDDEEKYTLGFIPDDNGEYFLYSKRDLGFDSPFAGETEAGTPEYLQRWLEPVDRSGLSGDSRYSGPGTAGLEKLWKFAR